MLRAFTRAGLTHDDIDFVTTMTISPAASSWNTKRRGSAKWAKAARFTMENIGLDDRFPVSPDGGCIGYSTTSIRTNFRIIEAVKQFPQLRARPLPQLQNGEHTYDRNLCRKIRDPRIAVACGPMTGTFSMALLAKD